VSTWPLCVSHSLLSTLFWCCEQTTRLLRSGILETYFPVDILYVFLLTKILFPPFARLPSVLSYNLHTSVLQQKNVTFFRIVSRFLNGEAIADKLFDNTCRQGS
jgi:hypothetical protein